ncbi:unnamed protein product [Arctia plantaginis]|uniref:Uncharacterized protein n=1 Tax=Arctia plantaginis TaxID=874455 RepID=A0A8S1BH02_ARCPL|nr:unnamed protein product [Arctia plantaginis]
MSHLVSRNDTKIDTKFVKIPYKHNCLYPHCFFYVFFRLPLVYFLHRLARITNNTCNLIGTSSEQSDRKLSKAHVLNQQTSKRSPV